MHIIINASKCIRINILVSRDSIVFEIFLNIFYVEFTIYNHIVLLLYGNVPDPCILNRIVWGVSVAQP